MQVPCPAHNQIIHNSADAERFLTDIHDSSGKSQEISTDKQGQVFRGNHAENNFLFATSNNDGRVTLIEETSVPPSPNVVHLSASHVSSI